jgi:hypothetical protein
MNKHEIEELRKSVNLRLVNSKYKEAFLDVFGDLDCLTYIRWMVDVNKNPSDYDNVKEKIKSYPSLIDWKIEEDDSISIIHGEYIESIGENFIEISISYNGKNISGVKIPIICLVNNPSKIIRDSLIIGHQADFFTKEILFTSILDDNCVDNKTFIDYIKNLFKSLKDIKQIAARIELSAALFGDELVDRALTKCGVMNLKELRFAAED